MSEISSRPVSARKGLARLRPLVEAPKLQSEDEKHLGSLPNGWIYDEVNQDDFWNQMEVHGNPDYEKALENTNKKAQNMSDMGDCSKKIKSIVSQFDQIEQDTLVSMLEIAPDIDSNGELNTNAILDETRNTMITFIDDMADCSKSQELQMLSLQNWLITVQKMEKMLTSEFRPDSEIPDVGGISDALRNVIEENTKISEKANDIHRDINDYWQRQLIKIKKSMYIKDQQIKELNDVIEMQAQQKVQREKRRKRDEKKAEELEKKDEQIQQYIKQMEDMKMRLDDLKKQMALSQAQNAASATHTSYIESAERDTIKDRLSTEIMSLKIDSEAKIGYLTSRIEKLEQQLIDQTAATTREREAKNALQGEIDSRDKKIANLEATVLKYIKLLDVEKEKPEKVVTDVVNDTSELENELMKAREELKAIKENHLKELREQEEILRERTLADRKKLIQALTEGDNNGAVSSLVSDYEEQLQSQKDDYSKIIDGLTRQAAANLAILTKQYDTRIKDMSVAHQNELIAKQKDIAFEVKKAEINMEETFNKKMNSVLTTNSERERELNTKIKELEERLENTESENIAFKEYMSKTSENMNMPKLELQVPRPLESSRSMTSQRSLAEGNAETKLAALFITRQTASREENDEQMNWALHQQERAYQQMINEAKVQTADLVRPYIQAILDSLATSEKDGLATAVNDLANALSTMNEASMYEKPDAPTIPLDEANRRTKVLAERVARLKSKLLEHTNNSDVNFEGEVEKLKKKVAFLESIQNGENSEAIKSAQELETMLRNEIAEKNMIIEEMQKGIELKDVLFADHQSFVIFDLEPTIQVHMPEVEYEYDYEYEEDEPQKSIPFPTHKKTMSAGNLVKLEEPKSIDNEETEEEKEPEIENENENDNDDKNDIDQQLSSRTTASTDSEVNMREQLISLKNSPPEIQRSHPEFVREPEAPKNSPLVPSQSSEHLDVKPLIEEKIIPAVINVSQSESKSAPIDVHTEAKVKSSKKHTRVKKNISVDKLNVEDPSVFRVLKPKSKRKPGVILEMAKTSSLHLADTFYVSSKRVTAAPKLESFPIISVSPDPLPPLIINDENSRHIITELQQKLADLTLKKEATEMELRERRKLFESTRVALVDKNDQIIACEAGIKSNLPTDTQQVTVYDNDIKPMSKRQQRKNKYEHAAEKFMAREQNTPIDFTVPYLDIPESSLPAAIGGVIRFIRKFRSNEMMLMRMFKNDLYGYHAYLQATELLDEADEGFFQQIKESQGALEKNSTALDELVVAENTLLSIAKEARSQMSKLREIASDEHKKDSSDEKVAIDLPDKIMMNEADEINGAYAARVILALADDIIPNNEEIKALYNKLMSTREDDRPEIDSIIDEATAISREFIRKIKHNGKKFQDAARDAQYELKKEKEFSALLSRNLSEAKAALSNEKQSNESSVRIYKQQIKAMRDIFEHLHTGSLATPEDLATAVKNEVLMLQSTLEMGDHERERLRHAAAEALEERAELTAEIGALRARCSSLEEELSRSEARITRNRELMLEQDAEKHRLLLEKDADLAQSNEQLKINTIEKDEFTKLKETITQLQIQLQTAKFDVRRKDVEIDDLTVKLALATFYISKRPSVATQTTGDIDVSSPNILRQSVDSFSLSSGFFSSISTGNNSPRSLGSRLQSPMLHDSSELFRRPSSPMFKDASDFFSGEILPPIETQEDNQDRRETGEAQVVPAVHKPLKFVPKRSKASILASIPKTTRPSTHMEKKRGFRPPPLPKFTSIEKENTAETAEKGKEGKDKLNVTATTVDVQGLAIGNVEPGKRPLTGATVAPHNTTTARSALIQKTGMAMHPQEVSPVTSVHFGPIEHPIRLTSLKPLPIPEPEIPPAEGEIGLYPDTNETITITNVVYKSSQNDKTVRAPNVDPPLKLSVNPSAIKAPPDDNDERIAIFERTVAKLREALTKSQTMLNERETQLQHSEMKVAELQKENKRLFAEKLRAEDVARRSAIRHEDAAHRLAAMTDALAKSENELSTIRRELSSLRALAAAVRSLTPKLAPRPAALLARCLGDIDYDMKALHSKDTSSFAQDNAEVFTARSSLSHMRENERRSTFRAEARKKMWADKEREQVLGALAALSLISTHIDDDIQNALNNASLMREHNPYSNLWNRRSSLREVIESDMKRGMLVESTPVFTLEEKEEPVVEKKFKSFAHVYGLLDKLDPPLTEEERRLALSGKPSPQIIARLKAVDSDSDDDE